MRVDDRGSQIPVAHELLNRSEVIPASQEMGSKGIAERGAGPPFEDGDPLQAPSAIG